MMEIGKYYRVGDVPADIDAFDAGYPWSAPLGGFVYGSAGKIDGDAHWSTFYLEECAPDDPGAHLCEMGTVIAWDRRRGGEYNPHETLDISPDSDRLPPERWYARCWRCGWEGPDREEEQEAWNDCMRHRDDPRLFGGDRVVLPAVYREVTSDTEVRYSSGGNFMGENTIWKFLRL